MIDKIKDFFTHENLQAGITYITSSGLISAIFVNMNSILQGIGLLVGIAIGVQRYLFDRERFRERRAKRQWTEGANDR